MMSDKKENMREAANKDYFSMEKIGYEEIKRFIRLVEKSEISELEIVQAGVTLRIKKDSSGAAVGQVYPVPTIYAPPPQPVQTAPEAPPTPSPTAPPSSTAEETAGNLVEIKSPMVGTFYRAASPGAEPFANIDETIVPGKVLCIIEAMKLMNEIESEVTGIIVEICVENGKPVEYGQTLFKVEPK